MKETLRCEWVRCCNPRCRACPHGPYWYAYWREGKRTRKRYIGKQLPPPPPPASSPSPHRWDAIFDRRTATLSLAYEILAIGPDATFEAARTTYRRLMLLNHPDRGGDVRLCAWQNCAWEYVRAAKHW